MFIDNETVVADSQAVTVSAPSANYINLGGPNAGTNGKRFAVSVKETFVGPNGATLEAQLQSDDTSVFASPSNVGSSGAIALTKLVAGYQFFMAAPVGPVEQYLRAYFNVAGGPLTAGKITIGVVDAPQASAVYSAVR